MAFTNIYDYLKRISKGHLHGKLKNSTILEKNTKEKEKYRRKEQRGLLFFFIKKTLFSLDKLTRFPICKSTNHMHLTKH